MTTTNKPLMCPEEITDFHMIWQDSSQFRHWLLDDSTLKLLSEAVGLKIYWHEYESPWGLKQRELIGIHNGVKHKIIIENQLDSQDDNHLDSIAKCLSDAKADIIILVAPRIKKNHALAMEWLKHNLSSIEIFLVELKLWKIHPSLVVPKFALVTEQDIVRPCD